MQQYIREEAVSLQINDNEFDEGYCQAIDDVMGVLHEEDRNNVEFRLPNSLVKLIGKMKDPFAVYRRRLESERKNGTLDKRG